MSKELVPYEQQLPFEGAAFVADDIARREQLEKYQRRRSHNTLRRQKADIALFRYYLSEAHITAGDLFHESEAWRGVSWGIVEGFREWQLQQGYSIGSIKVRLSTVQVYARIAFKAGVLDERAIQLIQTVKGLQTQEAHNIDEKRKQTRRGAKKAEPTRVSPSHMKALRAMLESDTSYTGRRDYVLACLLGYQGLRCGEVAALQVANIDLTEGIFVFYRQKVLKTQRHEMHPTTLQAMQCYIEAYRPTGPLFLGVDHAAWTDSQGKFHKAHTAAQGLSTRAINERVRYLGEHVGINHLSPHDLRHYWTQDAFKHKTLIDTVMQAGGWNSYAMPLRYRGDTEIANEGIKQSQ
jgi:integrase